MCLTTIGVAEVLAQQPPTTGGTRVRDGELLVIDAPARVRIINRRQAQVQTVYNAAERWLIVMVGHASEPKKASDGGTDVNFTFHDVAEWPLGERWSGAAIVDEYSVAGEMPSHGIGLATETLTIQILGERGSSPFRDPNVAAQVSYRGMGRGGGGSQPFSLAAERLAAQASYNVQLRSKLPGGAPDAYSRLEMGVSGGPGGSARPSHLPAPNAPVRVGGNVSTPRKIVDVPPAMPEQARKAGVSGTVIVEATIGADGRVVDAKVLRAIPLLTEAALEAVRQWVYEPTYLNGVAVPVIMTVTVSFR